MSAISQCRGGVSPPVCAHVDVFRAGRPCPYKLLGKMRIFIFVIMQIIVDTS